MQTRILINGLSRTKIIINTFKLNKNFMKNIITTAVFIFTISSSFSQESLGLAERRALKEYQDTQFPEIKKGIETAAGFGVALDIKWEQIAKVGQSGSYKDDEYWGTTIFKPLTKALASVASDKMGKDALKAKLKKVVIIHDEKTAPASNFPNGLTWDAGVLTINWTPYSNADENFMAERITALKDLIESKL